MRRSIVIINRLTVVLILLLSMASYMQTSQAAEGGKSVYVIPVTGEVEQGLASFIERALTTAAESNADHIILEIDTPGGYVNAALDIVKEIRNIDVPVTAFVKSKAISAGAFITLNADNIMMAPGSTMGAAAIIDASGNAAGKKAQSFWRAQMKSSAQLHDRDPLYALAMIDPEIDLPKYGAGKGKLLTLTAEQALEVGYADATADNRDAVLKQLGLSSANIEEIEVSLAEKVARFLTSPIVVPILLAVGTLGFVIEFFSPGFGIPGIIGAVSILLYFFGHMVAGLAGWEALVLLGAGIIMLFLEVFVPGGILGILGMAAILVSIFLTAASFEIALVSVLVSIIVAVVAAFIIYKYWGYRGVMKKLVLSDATHSDLGYVSYKTREELLGTVGDALTTLRPSGTGVFGNERIDVVSEGGFVAKGQKIKVVQTEGSRVVVRAVEETE